MNISITLDDKYAANLDFILQGELKDRREKADGDLRDKGLKACLPIIKDEDQAASNIAEKQAVQNKLAGLVTQYIADEKAKMKPLTASEYFKSLVCSACEGAAKQAKEAKIRAMVEAEV